MQKNKNDTHQSSRDTPTKSEDWLQRALNGAQELDQDLRDLVAERPLMSMGAAIAVGYLGAVWIKNMTSRMSRRTSGARGQGVH